MPFFLPSFKILSLLPLATTLSALILLVHATTPSPAGSSSVKPPPASPSQTTGAVGGSSIIISAPNPLNDGPTTQTKCYDGQVSCGDVRFSTYSGCCPHNYICTFLGPNHLPACCDRQDAYKEGCYDPRYADPVCVYPSYKQCQGDHGDYCCPKGSSCHHPRRDRNVISSEGTAKCYDDKTGKEIGVPVPASRTTATADPKN